MSVPVIISVDKVMSVATKHAKQRESTSAQVASRLNILQKVAFQLIQIVYFCQEGRFFQKEQHGVRCTVDPAMATAIKNRGGGLTVEEVHKLLSEAAHQGPEKRVKDPAMVEELLREVRSEAGDFSCAPELPNPWMLYYKGDIHSLCNAHKEELNRINEAHKEELDRINEAHKKRLNCLLAEERTKKKKMRQMLEQVDGNPDRPAKKLKAEEKSHLWQLGGCA